MLCCKQEIVSFKEEEEKKAGRGAEALQIRAGRNTYRRVSENKGSKMPDGSSVKSLEKRSLKGNDEWKLSSAQSSTHDLGELERCPATCRSLIDQKLDASLIAEALG